MEITTIGFANHPFSAVSRRRPSAPPAAAPSQVKISVRSGERLRPSGLSGVLVLTTVRIEPLESHPVDRLLPQSRLQQMKKLLERAASAYPYRTKSPG